MEDVSLCNPCAAFACLAVQNCFAWDTKPLEPQRAQGFREDAKKEFQRMWNRSHGVTKGHAQATRLPFAQTHLR
jgi:hypothetical protein